MDDMFDDGPGHVIDLTPDLQMVLAPNPSPMTGPGTNTYIIGSTSVAVIDPGPLDDDHLTALVAAIGDRPVTHIIVTHSHLDHSPLARPLADHTNAPILAFGDSFAGRSAVMADLAGQGLAGGGEGIDLDFVPDEILRDGDEIEGAGWTLKVLHTPGHLGNHIALVWKDAVFVGDVVMGWSTSLVSPPDGDMTDFLESCRTLRALSASVLYSGHGAPICDPNKRLSELIAHRESRTAAILDALRAGPATVQQIVSRVYVELDPALYGAAGRNVFAHLVALHSDKTVTATPTLSPDATFAI